MNHYLVKRGASYLLVLAVALTLNFWLPRLMPGSPLEAWGSETLTASVDEATLAALRQYYGLDQPAGRQFLHYLSGLTQGELGFSLSYKEDVSQVIASRLPWTLLLIFSSLLLTFGAALFLGTRAGLGKGGSRGVTVAAVILDSIPPFVLGAFLILLFGVKWPLFPISGAYTPFTSYSWWGEGVGDIARHLALPVLALSAHGFFSPYLLVRNGVKMVKNEAYVRMAQVQGLAPRTIAYDYILRTALLPVVTMFSLRTAGALGGAVLVETVFAYPGLGQLTYEAVLAHDYPLLQGLFFFFTLWVLAINFLTDFIYLKLDPRVQEV